MNVFSEVEKSKTCTNSPSVFSLISSLLSVELTLVLIVDFKALLFGCAVVIVLSPIEIKVVVQSKAPSSLDTYSKLVTIPIIASKSPFPRNI